MSTAPGFNEKQAQDSLTTAYSEGRTFSFTSVFLKSDHNGCACLIIGSGLMPCDAGSDRMRWLSVSSAKFFVLALEHNGSDVMSESA